jgi:hypothetical protein
MEKKMCVYLVQLVKIDLVDQKLKPPRSGGEKKVGKRRMTEIPYKTKPRQDKNTLCCLLEKLLLFRHYFLKPTIVPPKIKSNHSPPTKTNKPPAVD